MQRIGLGPFQEELAVNHPQCIYGAPKDHTHHTHEITVNGKSNSTRDRRKTCVSALLLDENSMKYSLRIQNHKKALVRVYSSNSQYLHDPNISNGNLNLI